VLAIQVDNLEKRYGELVAVDDVSFAVEAGEIFALLGPNGAGKTTTVEILEGLRRRDGGTVSVLGADPAREMRSVAGRIGVMPQSGDLQQGLKAGEAVRLFAAFYDDPETPAALMDRLGLGSRTKTTYRRLSGGEKKRLSLALALVGRPSVAFLDEPTAGMDVEGRATAWQVITELRDRGAAVVLTTHLLDEAERVADRVAIMSRGRIVAAGAPADLAGPDRNIMFTTEQHVDPDALGSALGVRVEWTAGTYRIARPESDPALVARLTAWLAGTGVSLRTLTVGGRSLEDVYLELTSR
jgi:ABC-2 type transport system ATP-binding protein